ncbi:MAG: hypothetical protein ACK4FF_10650 [Limnobacter sp.]|uniref:hypothetical protein n=1 Tax=Limnobacter sp. TaxID=2003368 RepID=UPI003918FBD3
MAQATVTSLVFDGQHYHLTGWCFDKKKQQLASGFALSYGEKADPLNFERTERHDLTEKLGEEARMSGFRIKLSTVQAASVLLGQSVKLINFIGGETHPARYAIPGLKLEDPKAELAAIVRDAEGLLNKPTLRDILYSLCNLMLVNYNPELKKTAVDLMVAAALLQGLAYEGLTEETPLYGFFIENLPAFIREKPTVIGRREHTLLLNSALALGLEGAPEAYKKTVNGLKQVSTVADYWVLASLFLQANVLVFTGKLSQDVSAQFQTFLTRLKTVVHGLYDFTDDEVDVYSDCCQMAYATYLIFHVNSGELELSVLQNDFTGLERRIYFASKGCVNLGLVRSRF